jgi:hypothetical protein
VQLFFIVAANKTLQLGRSHPGLADTKKEAASSSGKVVVDLAHMAMEVSF